MRPATAHPQFVEIIFRAALINVAGFQLKNRASTVRFGGWPILSPDAVAPPFRPPLAKGGKISGNGKRKTALEKVGIKWNPGAQRLPNEVPLRTTSSDAFRPSRSPPCKWWVNDWPRVSPARDDTFVAHDVSRGYPGNTV